MSNIIFLLAGDSGYPLRKTMMTALLDATEGSSEAYYTNCHVKTRNVITQLLQASNSLHLSFMLKLCFFCVV